MNTIRGTALLRLIAEGAKTITLAEGDRRDQYTSIHEALTAAQGKREARVVLNETEGAKLAKIRCIPIIVKAPYSQTEALDATVKAVTADRAAAGWGAPYVGQVIGAGYEERWLIYKTEALNPDAVIMTAVTWLADLLGAYRQDQVQVSIELMAAYPLAAEVEEGKDRKTVTGYMLKTARQCLHMAPEEEPVGAWLTERGFEADLATGKTLDIYTIKGRNSITIYYDKARKEAGIKDATDPGLTWQEWKARHAGDRNAAEMARAEEEAYRNWNADRPIPGELRTLQEPYPREKLYPVLTWHELMTAAEETPEFIQTGWTSFDRKSRGLPRKEVVMVTAPTGGGKSTMMTQLKVNLLLGSEARVWEYNGEMSAPVVARNIELAAAGATRLQTPARGIYEVTKDQAETIWGRIGDRYMLYPNRLGSRYDILEDHLTQCIRSGGVDVAIFDDQIMMDLNIPAFAQYRDDDARAVALVRRLKLLAEHYNLCVILICHPRKDTPAGKRIPTLTTAEDILGSVKQVSLAATVLVYHRIYDGQMDAFFRKAENTGIIVPPDSYLRKITCSGMLQVVKDRYGAGNQSYLIPITYEPGSNRLYSYGQARMPYDCELWAGYDKAEAARVDAIYQEAKKTGVNPFLAVIKGGGGV